MTTMERLEKENADLKRQIEAQRSDTLALLEQVCYGVNEIRVLLGEEPCGDWLKNAPNNWPHAFKESRASDTLDS